MAVTEIYEQTIKPLPPEDRFRLATLILNDIPPQSVVEYSEEWSEEDLQEFARSSWGNSARSLGDEEDARSR
ncbi:MAG TPA: hypothetical protein VFJ58_28650 [Armatimonadota bacterium]|nr:hypothetical protein [Armatimonadota bacterium]